MSKITYVNNKPFIEIGNELIAPAAFRSFRPQPYNVAQFSRMGVRLYQMIVSGKINALGDMYSLYGPVWIGDHKYDFSAFDKQIEMFIKFAPKGYFCVMIQLDTPQWWLEENEGIPDSFTKLGQAIVSEKWINDASDYLQALICYAEKKYGDKIFAYSFSCGLCTEWFMDDLGKPTPEKEKLYRKYLGDENATIPILTTESHGIIPDSPIETTCETSLLREPYSNEAKYMEFNCKLNNELLLKFAHKAQEILNHEKLISVFYGYIDQGTSLKQNLWFTNYFEEVWKSPDIDILTSPASYNDNRDFDGVPLYQNTVDSIALNNKLYLHEMDHRTDLAYYPLSTGRFMWDCCDTPQESIAILRRELCNAMLKSAAIWWFDFYGGYFSSPEYEKELKHQLEIYNELYKTNYKQIAKIAVFVDGKSMNLMREKANLVPECVRSNLTELVKSGAMIQTFNLCDITKINHEHYKMFVFLNALEIPDNILGFIKSELKDKYKFYVYAPNIAHEDTIDPKRICDITGIEISQYSENNEIRTATFNNITFGFHEAVNPSFKVTDDNVQKISNYTNGDTCVCRKGKTFYSAVGNIPYQLWQQAEKEAGIHIYSETGSYVAATSDFIVFQNAKSDECKINLEFDCELEELFDGGTYKTENKMLSYTAPKGDTKLFKIKKRL